MRPRRPFVVGVVAVCAAGALVGACASDEGAGEAASDSGALDAVPSEATVDAAQGEGDAAPCADCDDFPAVCTPDALCPNGPFELSEGALDRRTDILVVRGRGPNDVWAAGAMGAVAHFDGTSWARSDLGSRDTQRVLWLRDPGEVAFGSVIHIFTRGLDGGADDEDAGVSPDGWSRRPPPTLSGFDPSAQSLRSSWGAPGSNTLWMATRATSWMASSGLWRLRYTSSSTFEIARGIAPAVCADIHCDEMAGIHGASQGTVWAVGGAGAAIRISGADGEAPTAKAFNSQTAHGLRGVWAASDTDVWAVGATGTIRHYRGDPLLWEIVRDVPTNKALNGVFGTSSSDIWAVGDAGVVLHYDGQRWSRVKVAGLGGLRPNLYDLWSPAPGHVWVGGQGVVLSVGGKP